MLEPGGGGGGTPTSSDGLVCPAAFPAKSDDLKTDKIRESADALRKMGRQVRDRVEDIDGTWARLQPHYEAPEEHRVYTLLDPAVTSARDLRTTLRTAAHHLDTYASELDRIKPRLKALETEAEKFRARVIDGVPVDASEAQDPSFGEHVGGAIDAAFGGMPGISVEERQVIVPWDQDTATYEDNSALVARYNQMYEEISTAAISCANSINGLVEENTPQELEPARAEQLSVPGKQIPWGYPTEEERNCPEAVGHGTKDAAGIAVGQALGVATLLGGYNPNTHLPGDRDYQWQAWVGLGNSSVAAVVTAAAYRQPRLRVFEWVRRQEDLAKTVYGEDFGYDHQAEMAGGDGLHKWHDDPVAMGTTLAWSVVPALFTGGIGLGVKGAAIAGKAVPDGMKRPTRSTGDVLAALARGDATGRGAVGGSMKAYATMLPSGALGNKAVNALDVELLGRGTKDAPRPVSESIESSPRDGRGPAAGATDGRRPPTGTRTSVNRPGTYEPGQAPETIPAKESGRRYTPDDVQRALDEAPQNEWGDPVDPRNGQPLLLENINGDRGWEMRWDPEGETWVAENRGLGEHGLPARGKPDSYGYDSEGRRLPFANHRPEYGSGQVEKVWRQSREAQLRQIDNGRLPLPRPDSENQMWVRVRDNVEGSDLVDLGDRGKWRQITWDPKSPRGGVWDMGHVRRAKYADLHDRYMKGEMSTEKFLNAYRDPTNYEVQDPGRNRAHDDE